MRVVSSMMCAVAMLVALGSLSCAAATSPVAPVATPAGVRFVLANAEALSVALAGSFNQWSASSHPLRREKSRGVWTVVVTLPPGEHLFMYVVDGTRWISPPGAEDYVDDGFGARNGVVIVRAKER